MKRRSDNPRPVGFLVGVLACLAAACPSARAETVQTVLLMPGTPCETRCWVKTGETAGPRLFIAGGMHGDEKAGYLAADRLVNWRITKGTLILVPRAHQMAIARGERAYPGNMNAMFPGDPAGDLMHRLAHSIWRTIVDHQPDLVVTLHESVGFHRDEPARYGQTLTYDFDVLTPLMQAIIARGLIPVLSIKHQNAARIARFQSVAEPAAPLAGRWR